MVLPSARKSEDDDDHDALSAREGYEKEKALFRDEISSRALKKLHEMDMNQLHTALNNAIRGEDYALAAKIRDVIRLADEARGIAEQVQGAFGWEQLGVPDWLARRAEDLGYIVPMEIQRRSVPIVADGNDCIIECETGSGKTLAFLLPTLSRLDYPPVLYPEDLPGPQLVIIVPTKELGVQIVMLVYKVGDTWVPAWSLSAPSEERIVCPFDFALSSSHYTPLLLQFFGGSVNVGIPGERSNLFRYKGPRGLKVKGLLLEHEVDLAVNQGYLRGCHVVVGTPELVAEAQSLGIEAVQHAKTVVIDEVDACMHGKMRRLTEDIMRSAISNSSIAENVIARSDKSKATKPSVVIVGATLSDELIQEVGRLGWLKDPVHVSVGHRMRMPSGLIHRYILVDEVSKVLVVARQLREDLKVSSPDAAPARVMLFADSEKQARFMADPLRTSLWGDHALSILLPKGVEPIKALHSFRDHKSTLLLATPEAARGLDLPGVSHVYNMSPPPTATEYLHRAGRAGRIGSSVAGVVTTLVSSEQKSRLVDICRTLGVDIEEIPLPQSVKFEQVELEDETMLEQVKKDMEAALAMTPDDEHDADEHDT